MSCAGPDDADRPDDARGDVTSFCDVPVPLLTEQVTFPGEGPM